MFSSRGLFKNIPCPGKHNCNLPNCLFGHDLPPAEKSNTETGQVYDPETVITADSPPAAERVKLVDSVPIESQQTTGKDLEDKIEPEQLSRTALPTIVKIVPAAQSLKRKLDNSPTNTADQPPRKKRSDSPMQQSSLSLSTTISPRVAQPTSATRSVSPPAIARTNNTTQTANQAKPRAKVIEIKDEPLQPRVLQNNTVLYTERHKKLNKLHEWLQSKQTKLRAEKKLPAAKLMNERELKKVARDEEERLALAAKGVTDYNSSLAALYRTLNTMTPDIFGSHVQSLRSTGIFEQPADVSTASSDESKSTLDSIDKQRFVLRHIRTGLLQYAKFGYVVKPPPESEVAKAIAAEKLTNGLEECDRCSTRFQIFRGRNAEGKLASKGPCRYHWGRLRTGNFTCCNNSSGVAGCTLAENHVFKVTDPARLAALLQFKETPKPNPEDQNRKSKVPVVFDCEMGYTTCGFELIRVTALEWPNKKVLLDVLVRTIGEVIDLNTRFSGVSEQIYSTAPNFPEISTKLYPTSGEPLQKVASPAAARDFMFSLLDPDTPLLGHAIENDLNACRMIHPFVIDTVLLYPARRPLPMRKALRDLASEFLGRTIQASGAQGHDSKEDSEATGDLVLLKVKEKWTQMKIEQWQFVEKDGQLTMVKGKVKAGSSYNTNKL